MSQHVLIIEDSEELRQPIAEALRLEGFAVTEAGDGVEGIKMLKDHRPDIILCDIMMPELDGYDVLKYVRAQAELIDVPFVYLSAKTESRDIRMGMQLTADDYLTKPVKMGELLQTLKVRLRHAQIKRDVGKQRMLHMKESIARMLPHELISPLTSVLALSEYMSQENDLDAAMVRELSADIHLSGIRLWRMIKNYLMISELMCYGHNTEQALPEYEIKPISLQGVVIEWAQACAIHWGRLGDLDLDVGQGEIITYAKGVEHLLVQLLDNAFKFSNPDSIVRLIVALNGGKLCIEVEDKGRGMRADNIPKIDLFNQFDRDYFEQQGSGLGLAIVKTLLDIMNGGWDIKTTQGEGTRVALWIPVDSNLWNIKPA